MNAHFLRHLPVIPLLVALLGAGVLYSSFDRIRLGPFYILEWIFATWLIVTAATGTWRDAIAGWNWRPWRDVRAGAFFFALWCGLVAVSDLCFRRDEIASFERFAQHCLLFVYPLMWTLAGAWLARQPLRPLAIATCVLVVLNGVIPIVRHMSWINMSTGALCSLLPVYFASRACEQASGRHRYLAVVLAAAMPVFWPFWREWRAADIQRVTLGLYLFMLGAGPFVMNWHRKVRALAQSAMLLGLFAGGIVAVSIAGSSGAPAAESLRSSFYGALQHGEDFKYDRGGFKVPGASFGFNDRRFWWRTSYEDWLKNPLTGIGFGPEVPSYVRAGVRNDGIFAGAPDMQSYLPKKPISGPHNSYLTILVRTGPLGLFAMGLIVVSILLAALKVARRSQVSVLELTAIFIALNGFLHAFVQLGFETPRNCVLLWLFAGVLMTLKDSRSETA